MTLNLIRDDGAVVYINGMEVFRSNMPDDDIGYETYALEDMDEPAEADPVSFTINSSLFVRGDNVIAVEVHQSAPNSPDLSFDLQMIGNEMPTSVTLARGPYLQVGTSSNVVVRWRTNP